MDLVCIGQLLCLSFHLICMMIVLLDLPLEKPGIKQRTFKVVNGLKDFISQEDNEAVRTVINFYSDHEANDFIKNNKL